eukprot:TRINITY_DN459_c0_g1_i3.p1 TRINITY_DN459_c0_g1~~TRINITY_DN459_c0_g1_i3.p1  ORF type:complete len:320 (+),score=134.24 TRINITY_DN459_c0_g1_i3:33-962(+)
MGDPQKGQVLVKFLAAPINPADLNMVEGTYGIRPQLPAVGGNEGAAVVVATGPDVKNLAVNDIVIPATPGFGTWRTHALAEENSFDKIPQLPAEYAATLAVNPATAFRLLHDFVSLKPGDVVVQNAANSVVGQCVIQLAKAQGVKTINIIRDRPNYADAVNQLKALGADVVVTEEFARSAEMNQVLSDLQKPALALNAAGGAASTDLVRLVGHNGVVVTYGGMSKQPVIVPTSALIFKNVQLRGFWLSRWITQNSRTERQEMLASLAKLVSAGQLKWAMERKSFSQFESALAAAQQPYRSRKVVLTFDS